MHDGASAGHVHIGLGGLDIEPPVVQMDFIQVKAEPRYRHGLVSSWLIDTIIARWPRAGLVAGPVEADEDAGPSFRVRTWERGVELHDSSCEHRLPDPSSSCCQCLFRAKRQACINAARYRIQ